MTLQVLALLFGPFKLFSKFVDLLLLALTLFDNLLEEGNGEFCVTVILPSSRLDLGLWLNNSKAGCHLATQTSIKQLKDTKFACRENLYIKTSLKFNQIH